MLHVTISNHVELYRDTPGKFFAFMSYRTVTQVNALSFYYSCENNGTFLHLPQQYNILKILYL